MPTGELTKADLERVTGGTMKCSGGAGLRFVAEVVDDEPNEKQKKCPQHNSQCDLEHHGYLGPAFDAGLISCRKLKNSDLVERIIKSLCDKTSL